MFKIRLPIAGFYINGNRYVAEPTKDGFILLTKEKDAVKRALELGGVLLEGSYGEEEKEGKREEDARQVDSTDKHEKRSSSQAVGNPTRQKDSDDSFEQNSESRNWKDDNIQRKENKGNKASKGKGKSGKNVKKPK